MGPNGLKKVTFSNAWDSYKDILKRKSILFVEVLNFLNKPLFYGGQPTTSNYIPDYPFCTFSKVYINICNILPWSNRQVM